MSVLLIPDSVAVTGDALAVIADVLGVPVAQLRLTGTGISPAVDLKAGGWLYERVDDDDDAGPADRVLAAGVTGFPVGSRWSATEVPTPATEGVNA